MVVTTDIATEPFTPSSEVSPPSLVVALGRNRTTVLSDRELIGSQH